TNAVMETVRGRKRSVRRFAHFLESRVQAMTLEEVDGLSHLGNASMDAVVIALPYCDNVI
ncbi:hypothetical protein, partial [Thermosynechococcus sp.]|uniref:hypothetical protein n=1 Tax=Thermosynechococcus sp. TaxID=2814275 RepID=UPI00391DE175